MNVLSTIYTKFKIVRSRKIIQNNWIKEGKPIPPPTKVKHLIIEEYRKKSNLCSFVETGTFKGETTFVQSFYFKSCYTIELSTELYRLATEKFKSFPNVHLYHGDSAILLGEIVPILSEPALFWLDGHYSEGETAKGDLNTPIMKELEIVIGDKRFKHLILIDDARDFIGKNDYPTINSLKEYVAKLNPSAKFTVVDDIIRIEQ